MNIAILSRNPRLYSTRRIRDAAIERGFKVRVLDTLKFSISVEEAHPDLYHRGRSVSAYDAIIPRIGTNITFFGCAVVRQFEQMGVFSLNSSQAISVSRDKLRTLQIFSRHNIGLPHSMFVRDPNDVMPAIEIIGGAPVIIKVLEGTQGVGVILADSAKMAEAIIQTLHSARQNVLIQKFVKESKGRDVRAFVVGDRVVAAMRRSAQGQEFRSNVHRGGKTEAVELSEDFERTAVQAAQIMGLHVAGVDMLEAVDGPQVLEVNSSPGLEGIEGATNIDVAGAIIDYIRSRILQPDIDLRQRLTLQRGYGVAEFQLDPKNELVGKSIEQTKLDEREVRILSITRQGLIIPNPNGQRELLAGDWLLCYGKLITLKALIPPKIVRKKRRKTTA